MHLVIKFRPGSPSHPHLALDAVFNFLKRLTDGEKKREFPAGYAIYARRKKKDLSSENSCRLSHRRVLLLSLLSYVTRGRNNATHYLIISKSCDFYQKRTDTHTLSIGVKLG